jgi:hypothetical protein
MMISVKTFNIKIDNQIQTSRYITALQAAIGVHDRKNMYGTLKDSRNRLAATQFLELKRSNPIKWKLLKEKLPPDVWRASSTNTMEKALGKYGYVAVSHDQMDKIHDAIKNHIANHPEQWRGSKVPLNEIPKRIICIDPKITSEDLSKKIANF